MAVCPARASVKTLAEESTIEATARALLTLQAKEEAQHRSGLLVRRAKAAIWRHSFRPSFPAPHGAQRIWAKRNRALGRRQQRARQGRSDSYMIRRA